MTTFKKNLARIKAIILYAFVLTNKKGPKVVLHSSYHWTYYGNSRFSYVFFILRLKESFILGYHHLSYHNVSFYYHFLISVYPNAYPYYYCPSSRIRFLFINHEYLSPLLCQSLFSVSVYAILPPKGLFDIS